MAANFILPFLLNFGVNKALGMSTGKALGLAGVQSFSGGGFGGALEGALKSPEGITAALGQEAIRNKLLAEGGKSVASAVLDKKYGINPMLTYGGVTGLEGGIKALQAGQPFFEGATGAFSNPFTTQQPTPLSNDLALGRAKQAQDIGLTGGNVAKEKAKGLLGGDKGGILGYGTGADLAAGFGAITALDTLGGKGDTTQKLKEGPNLNYPTVKDIVTKFDVINPTTGKQERLEIGETPEERFAKLGYQPRTLKEGGIARFNNGSIINALPGKSISDEKDPSSYKRAHNFVTDETGNGDMEEDTMLAQLADGEFVTTAKAVLGAGILAGANPSNIKGMRDKGAKFFYEQQARFKRIYKLLEDARNNNGEVVRAA